MGHSIFPDGKFGEATEAAYNELMRANRKFSETFNSSHEGYAVIKEELDEMWESIKKNDKAHAAEEAIQVAAMCLRFAAQFGKYPYDPKWKEDKE